RKLEIVRIPESNDIDALSMLGYEASGIEHLISDVISELVCKRSQYYLECSSPIVIQEILHVLQKERSRPARRDDPGDFEEQRALCIVREAMRIPEGVVFSHARDAERLTRE